MHLPLSSLARAALVVAASLQLVCAVASDKYVLAKRQALPTANVQLQNFTLAGNTFSGNIYVRPLKSMFCDLPLTHIILDQEYCVRKSGYSDLFQRS
jgi:hypothetical protein